MTETKIKNISINSKTLESISNIKSVMDFFKDKNDWKNPLEIYIETLEESPFFEKLHLEKWGVLFDQWDIDNNLYIIKTWLITIERQPWKEDALPIQLSILKWINFFWEWSFNKSVVTKDTKVTALSKVELLKIDVKKNFKKFVEEFPTIWYEILQYIISETNKRLTDVSKLFTSSSEIEQKIKKLKEIDSREVFDIIDKIKNIVNADYILFFEKHSIVQNILTLKYDSRKPWKMLDLIFERRWYFLDLDELYEKVNIPKEDQIIINKISIWEEVYGFLIIWRENNIFLDSDKKMIYGISNSLAWVVKKYILDKENKSKTFSVN